MQIRRATSADAEAVWSIFRQVVRRGETYVYDPDIGRQEALAVWLGEQVQTYVALVADEIVGTYILKANQPGLGDHVANASFMVDPAYRGQGWGRLLGEHALRQARGAGYLAMQFNLVVATNTAAVALWEKLGFAVVGTLPRAFRHRSLGLVDAHVMYRWLAD
ncbi:MAG: GNAT family N-acetyltransferase [Candidatus Latescibacteria bacterium]|nr:GNAT family N-acetyltransferase [Candidatus Latescibacterota bacterium]